MPTTDPVKPVEKSDKPKVEKAGDRLLAGGLDPNDSPQEEIPGTDPLAEGYDAEKDPVKNPVPEKA